MPPTHMSISRNLSQAVSDHKLSGTVGALLDISF
jgi:hypothetical protein